jgi:hypothetical protein
VTWSERSDLREFDVVDLSAQKDDLPVDRTSVGTSLVRGVHDIEDLVHVLSHRASAPGYPCKALSTASRNTEWSALLPMAKAIIIKPNVYRLGRRRSTGVGVGAVCVPHYETHGIQSNEQANACTAG